jgi:hypothetical protein
VRLSLNTHDFRYFGDYTSSRDDRDFVPPMNVRTIDYNLDDHPDLLITRPGKPVLIRTYSLSDFGDLRAAPAFVDANYGQPIISDDNNAVQVGDVNGDGLSDFVVLEGGRFVVYLRKGKKPDMLTRVTDGLGATTTFTYEPISSLWNYTPTDRHCTPIPCEP